MQQTSLISVVIPVKDGEPWLDACLQGIMRQTLWPKTEIIIVDSGSTDGTVALLEKYPVRLLTVEPQTFNHGLTRNFGVVHCRGEYVVMTVQDATPTDERWLERLLEGFSVAENVAGVCGRQVVPHHRDKNPVDWFRPQSEPQMNVYSYPSAEAFNALPPNEKLRACSWDDVNAAYRREALLQIPFQKISYGEDAIWAKEALQAGYTLVYNPAATVYHYHNENFQFSFRRTLTVMHLRYRQFGFLYGKPEKSLLNTLRKIKTILRSGPFTMAERWQWLRYNLKQARAGRAANTAFFTALSQGEDKLDELHEKHCGKPPVPLKKQTYAAAN